MTDGRDEMEEKADELVQFLEGQETGNFEQLYAQDITPREIGRLLKATNQIVEFRRLMMYYSCAMQEVRTKLEVLDNELSLVQNRNPFESIKSRLKTPVSIYDKMRRRGYPFSVPNIEKYLNDVAGIRVICSFIDDIYVLRDCLVKQDDVRLIKEKDYIKNPKANGYRSLHLILETPIFLTTEKKYMRVEVQFRTIAMDFWASLEHKMQYKQNLPDDPEFQEISRELSETAQMVNELDVRMQGLREKIDRKKSQ